jgi:hypothetical protein
MHWILCCLVVAVGVAGCTSDTTSSETTGSLSLDLEVGNIDINESALSPSVLAIDL